MTGRVFSIVILAVLWACNFSQDQDDDSCCSGARLSDAEISFLQPDNDRKIIVKFDPRSFKINRRNTFAETQMPGLGHNLLQFTNREITLISVCLCFDSSDGVADVREKTREVVELMEIDDTTHAPPVLTLKWGEISYDCVLESIVEKYIAFFPDGRPAKASIHRLPCT